MYNLLVSALENAWDNSSYEYQKSRALTEFTVIQLTNKYSTFSEKSVEKLISFPCLFVYENSIKKQARLGWIKSIHVRSKTILIKFSIVESSPSFSNEELENIEDRLDIETWEFSRTHWAVKDVDLFYELLESKLISQKHVSLNKPVDVNLTTNIQPKVFQIPESVVNEKLVSVMMPFDKSFDAVFESIVDACKSVELRCQRADNIWIDSTVIQDIFSLIYTSNIIIVDFTHKNPNVLYETGIAHTLGRPVIPITQSENDVPFDLRHHRFLKYLPNTEGLIDMNEKLKLRLNSLA